MKTTTENGQSGRTWFSSRRKLVVLAVLLLVLLLAVMCVRGLDRKIARNDILLQEAKLLLASRNRWYRNGANTNTELPRYTVVGGRSGTVVLIDQEMNVDGTNYTVELGWTNSCLGPGMLMVTSTNSFLWRGSDGATRKLNIPDFKSVPIWWYVLNP